MGWKLLTGDSAAVLPQHGPFDMLFADPPYGDTSLGWDKRLHDWQLWARTLLKPTGSMWVFGSMRFLLHDGEVFDRAGWRFSQDVVWEKHNGSGFHADRFKRVHEHVVQFYRDDARWDGVYNEVQKTADATARAIRRKKRPAHMGEIDRGSYQSVDGGPRIMRSVLYVRSCHGRAIHPTEKPEELLEILIRTSCPPGGVVGDLFAGSGAAGEAALRCGRNYVGCEIDPDMAEKARARLGGNLWGGA